MKFTAFLIFCVNVHRPKVKSKVCTQELTSQVAHHAGTYLERCFKRSEGLLFCVIYLDEHRRKQTEREGRVVHEVKSAKKKFALLPSRSPRFGLYSAKIRKKNAPVLQANFKPGETRTKHSPHAQATSSTAEIALILIFPLGLTLESTKGIYTPGENVGKSREIV